MNLTISCEISLSKKLREVLGNKGGTFVLTTSELIDGKGMGTLSLTSETKEQYNELPAVLRGETSIQITPIDIVDETPSNSSLTHGIIFSTIPPKGESAPVVDKLAAVHAPEKGEEAYAVVAKKDIKVPDAFTQTQEPECKEWISNMEDLIVAVSQARSKKSDIDPDMAHNDRERALLMELKEKDEAIDGPAWIVNECSGKLIINDLDIILPKNSPYDLSNISARRIIMSRDLKALIKDGLVKFISPAERDQYILKQSKDDFSAGLRVFDSPDEAEANMLNDVSHHNLIIDDKSAMEITDEDIEGHTEEESMLINLTKNVPLVDKETKIISGPSSRHTVHGTTHISAKPAAQAKVTSKSPIRKLS